MKKLLVVVDMQNDFVTGCLGTKEAQEITGAVAEFVKGFDGGVVFTRDTHGEDYMNTQEGKKLPVPHCLKGSEGWEIVPELKGLTEGVKVFDKPTFGSTELAEYVKNGNYDEVTLIGVCTGICVMSNALLIKAFSIEVPVKVIADLCACVTPDTHQTALSAMATCQVEIIR